MSQGGLFGSAPSNQMSAGGIFGSGSMGMGGMSTGGNYGSMGSAPSGNNIQGMGMAQGGLFGGTPSNSFGSGSTGVYQDRSRNVPTSTNMGLFGSSPQNNNLSFGASNNSASTGFGGGFNAQSSQVGGVFGGSVQKSSVSYMDVIMEQKVLGYWDGSNQKLVNMVLRGGMVPQVPEELRKLGDDLVLKAWMTVLVLCWLEKSWANERKAWSLVHQKGSEWLKGKGINYEEFKDLANQYL